MKKIQPSLHNDRHSEIGRRSTRTAQPLTIGKKEKNGENKERIKNYRFRTVRMKGEEKRQAHFGENCEDDQEDEQKLRRR